MIQQNPHKEQESVWVDCECLAAHHAIRMWHMNEEDWNEFIIEMRVHQYRPFWKRLINAFRYIFNFDNRDGYYDSFHLRYEDVDKMVAMMLEYKRRREEKKPFVQNQEKL